MYLESLLRDPDYKGYPDRRESLYSGLKCLLGKKIGYNDVDAYIECVNILAVV